MGRAADLVGSASDNPKMEGCFQCHSCDEVVEEAEHIPSKKALRWVCSRGHVSEIEVLW